MGKKEPLMQTTWMKRGGGCVVQFTDWEGARGSLLGLEAFYSLIWVLFTWICKYIKVHHVVYLRFVRLGRALFKLT